MKQTRRSSVLALAGLTAAVTLPAFASEYPDKPVRLVVPWPAGGLVDIAARTSGTALGAALGQPFVVENKPGAGGSIGADGVAKAGFDLPSGASAVTIDVLDSSGKVIESQVRKNVQAGIQTFAWDGTAGGKTLPAGTYGLRVTAVNGGKPVDATPLTAATVQAALKTSSGTSLQLSGLGSRPLSDVRGVL